MLKLKNPPIIEAVLDIDCDLPPDFRLADHKEQIEKEILPSYPKGRQQLFQEHEFRKDGENDPEMSVRSGLQALQFLKEDEKQLIQFRSAGFSFNRLAPYSTLDDYLPEIESFWNRYCELVQPLQIKKIGLRMINRLDLPITNGQCRLKDYLKISPELPGGDDRRLTFSGFLNHHTAIEVGTDNQVNIVLTTQNPHENQLPVILDTHAFRLCQLEPSSWSQILEVVASLRNLKNYVFENSLQESWLNQYSQ